jgi:hypothetical protein
VVEVLLVALLALHLLLVDLAMAGPLVCVWLRLRETRWAEDSAGALARTLAAVSIAALAGGIALGGLLLAVRWWRDDHAYFEALAVIPAGRLWFALAEIGFFFACMAAYRGLWQRMRRRPIWHAALAIAAALNLLVHFPALFAIVSVVSARANLWGQTLDRAGYWRLLLDGEVLSRVLHVWLAAIAVTGVALMVLAIRLPLDAARQRLTTDGAIIALVPTLLQIPAGLWLALEMPEASRRPLIGGDLAASGLFAASILLALQLLHTLAAVALGDHDPKQVRRSVAMMLALVVLMVGTRWRIGQPAVALAPAPEVNGNFAAGNRGHATCIGPRLGSNSAGSAQAATFISRQPLRPTWLWKP